MAFGMLLSRSASTSGRLPYIVSEKSFLFSIGFLALLHQCAPETTSLLIAFDVWIDASCVY